MGIKGLTKILKSVEVEMGKEAIRPGSTLLIDGNGWLFYFLRSIENKEFGGCYALLASAISAEIYYFLDILGLKLVVFFDGEETKLKEETRLQRRIENDEKWAKLYHHCMNTSEPTMYASDIPRPVFARHQLVTTLQELQIFTITTEFEADQDMARYCVELNQQGFPCYCYGEDSDFIAMKDTPFIRFGDFNAENFKNSIIGKGPFEQSTPLVQVFRRSTTSRICGLTESQLVEWCILSGNDFTGSFEMSDFDELENGNEKMGKRRTKAASQIKDRCADAKRIIKQKTPDFKLHSQNKKLNLAIEFSRDFYELRDLSSYPVDHLDEEAQSVSLTFGDRTAITRWIETHQEALKSMRANDLSKICWSLLRDVYCSSQNDEFTATNLVDVITPTYLNTLERMSHQITEVDLLFLFYKFKHPNWCDIMFTHYYQLVCKFLLKYLPMYNQTVPNSVSPIYIFDAALFYTCLDDEILQLSMNQLSMTPSLPSASTSSSSATAATATAAPTTPTPTSRSTKKGKKSSSAAASPSPTTPTTTTTTANSVHMKTPVETDSQNNSVRSNSQSKKSSSSSKQKNNNVSSVVSELNGETEKKTGAHHQDTLPIDAYEEEILYRIQRDRVTIIQGETGCGKSSRIPVMLYESAKKKGMNCRMMVSQPRRIAASSLMKRVRVTLGQKVGLRMGHGIKDESDATDIYFVTTGYLVRLLAFHPDSFQNHTHIIIDEVHERSVDGDVLCYLVKQLLTTNSNIRVVLMSATIHTDLYASYFSDSHEYYGDMQALSVGLRRFPIKIHYVEELKQLIPGKSEIGFLTKRVANTCNRIRGDGDPGLQFPKDQYELVYNIIESKAVVGTGVLVFVAGMNDITDLQEKFLTSQLYELYAIHSDIPFEEQESVFEPTPPNKIKVVIATNAAESSITLPDVDMVICLGMHKHVTYDARTHRSLLQKSFISKASATQRAGRTGRVRPGEVYRIYTQQLFQSFSDFDVSEVLRTPLQETILSIRVMLEASPTFQGVIPVLEQLIEPPETHNVENSFQYLFENGMITTNDDTGDLTPTGKLVGALPVGITLGRLIAYGIQLGVVEDAAILATALTLPKSPFRIASPIIHTDPTVYQEIVQTIFLSAHKFDNGQYSEPLMLLNLLKEWRKFTSDRDKYNWILHHGVVISRIKYFDSASKHLVSKIQNIVGSEYTNINITDKERTNFLRLILAWTSEQNILRMKPHKYTQSELSTLTISQELLTLDQIESLFPSNDCLWQCKIINDLNFTLPMKSDQLINLDIDHSIRKLSSIIPQNSFFTITWIRLITNSKKIDYVTLHESDEESIKFLMDKLSNIPASDIEVSPFDQFITFAINSSINSNKKRVNKLNLLREYFSSCIYMMLQSKHHIQFHIKNCALSQSELREAFLPAGNDQPIEQKGTLSQKQVITFSYPPEIDDDDNNNNNHKCTPLFPALEDAPLGLKLYRAYLSGYNNAKTFRVKRVSKVVTHQPVVGSAEWAAARIQKDSKNQEEKGEEEKGVDDDVMDISSSAPTVSWKIFSSGSFVSTTLPRFSVTGSSIYSGGKTLFGTAYNCLTVGSQGQRVICEGVTLFPPGCAWFALAMACVEVDSYQFMHKQSFPEDEAIELSQLDLVENISMILKDSRDGWVVFNPPLVRFLLELFSNWTK